MANIKMNSSLVT